MHKLIMVIYLALAALAAAAHGNESILEARHPLNSVVYQQQNGQTCVRFFWRFNSGEPRKIQLEISPSRQFTKFTKREVLTTPPYFWCNKEMGRTYWRLVLLDDDNQPQETTEVRYFNISPGGLALTSPQKEEKIDLTASSTINFSWNPNGFDKKPLFYRFKVSTDRAFANPAINQDLDNTSVTITSLKNGTYYWKVGVKYTPYLPIQYSEVYKFEVSGAGQKSESPTLVTTDEPSATRGNAVSPEVRSNEKTTPVVPAVPPTASIETDEPSLALAAKTSHVEQTEKAAKSRTAESTGSTLPPAFKAVGPSDGRIFRQKEGESCVNFSWQFTDNKPRRVLFEASPSRRFKKIIKKESWKNPPYIWCHKEIGRQYWRLSRLDEKGKPSNTTPVRYVIISPSGMALGSPPGDEEIVAGQNLHFSWESKGFNQKPVFYRFKVASDRGFNKPLVNIDMDKNEFNIDTLKKGVYYWKVGVKYTPFIPIQYTEVASFRVRDPAPGEAVAATEKPAVMTIPTATTQATGASGDVYGAGDVEIVSNDKSTPTEPGKKESAESPAGALKPKQSPADNALIASATTAPDSKPDIAGPNESPAGAPAPIAPEKPLIAIESPNPLAPDDKRQLQTVKATEPVTLQWAAPANARFYMVEVSDNSEFKNSQRFRTSDTLLGLQKTPGEFYWHVKALGPEGNESVYSPTFTFAITKMAVTLEQKEPADGASFKYTKRLPLIRFAWQANVDALPGASYILRVGNNASLTHPFIQRELVDNFYPVDNLAAGDYYWQVGVRPGPDVQVQLSPVHKISVVMEKIVITPPVAIAPASGAKIEAVGAIEPIELRWQSAGQSSSFIIEIADNAAFKEAQKFSAFEPKLSTTKPKGTFYWRVKSLDANADESAFSTPSLFDVVSSTRSLQASAPASDQTLAAFKVNFRWLPHDGCQSYKVIVSPNKTLQNPLKTIETAALELAIDFDDEDTYYWCVQCKIGSEDQIKSPIRAFKITAAH